MNKLKYIRQRKQDGTYDIRIPLSTDSQNIIMQNHDNLQNTIDTLNDEIEDFKTKKVTERIKTALLSCFEHISWTDENGQDYYNELNDALYGITHLTLKSYDGETVIDTITCINGVPQTTIPEVPSRSDSSNGQYSYTPIGWSTEQNSQTADPTCTTNVSTNRIIYAAYSAEVKTYTVIFVRTATDGGGTLQTIQDVPYGTSITAANAYTGSTPTSTRGSATDYPFNSWAPTSAIVQGNVTFTAKFDSPVEIAEITDSWDTIIANIDNGTYGTRYKIGNYKPLDLGTEGTVNMQIVGIDVDNLANGSGKAPLSFVAKELLATTRRPGTTSNTWETSWTRTIYLPPIKDKIPSNILSRIQPVLKTHFDGLNTQWKVTTDDLWVPDVEEIVHFDRNFYYSGNLPADIPDYTSVYKDNDSRIKILVGSGSTSGETYVLRSHAKNDGKFFTVTPAGVVRNNDETGGGALGICLGFCLGLESETITDSWETILANPSYATDYSIGDTKEIDLGTEGKYLMEIVAFDEDNRADGNGKAGITWISKTLLNTTHRMNASDTVVGGWEASEMRSYLKNTIKPLIPATVRNAIVEVTKIQSTWANSVVVNGQTTTDDIWIPSTHEVFPSITANESTGATYGNKFVSNDSRIKKQNASIYSWYVRSVGWATGFRYTAEDGANLGNDADFARGIALGFCTN